MSQDTQDDFGALMAQVADGKSTLVESLIEHDVTVTLNDEKRVGDSSNSDNEFEQTELDGRVISWEFPFLVIFDEDEKELLFININHILYIAESTDVEEEEEEGDGKESGEAQAGTPEADTPEAGEDESEGDKTSGK
jgi:hypothetical protein